MTEEELNALVALLASLDAEASSAPWRYSETSRSIDGPFGIPIAIAIARSTDGHLTEITRNALPELLGALQAARLEVAELRAAIDRTRAYVDHPGNWSALDGRRRTILALLGGDG